MSDGLSGWELSMVCDSDLYYSLTYSVVLNRNKRSPGVTVTTFELLLCTGNTKKVKMGISSPYMTTILNQQAVRPSKVQLANAGDPCPGEGK